MAPPAKPNRSVEISQLDDNRTTRRPASAAHLYS